ncbi:MAG: hypothetical protein ABSG90_12795 [Dehalococcoidia bacterium]|jgi:hypothetical protein
MKAKQTQRGFIVVTHDTYANEPIEERLIQESSAIGDYKDSWLHPGSSALWIGKDHHLNREEVQELIERMQYWLNNKRLKL